MFFREDLLLAKRKKTFHFDMSKKQFSLELDQIYKNQTKPITSLLYSRYWNLHQTKLSSKGQTRDKQQYNEGQIMSLAFQHGFSGRFLQLFLLVCKITAFSVSGIIQNLTLYPRDKEGQRKIIARDKPYPSSFNMAFRKWFYCFSLFWYAKFCPPFVPRKYLSKNYTLIHNDLYSKNIVCVGK